MGWLHACTVVELCVGFRGMARIKRLTNQCACLTHRDPFRLQRLAISAEPPSAGDGRTVPHLCPRSGTSCSNMRELPSSVSQYCTLWHVICLEAPLSCRNGFVHIKSRDSPTVPSLVRAAITGWDYKNQLLVRKRPSYVAKVRCKFVLVEKIVR